MAGEVVQCLEVVEIDVEHREPARRCDVLGQQPVESGAVQKTGQRVVAGSMGKFLLALLRLGDVAHRAQDLARRLGVGEPYQRFEMSDFAVPLDDAVLHGDDLLGLQRRQMGPLGVGPVVRMQIAVPEVLRHFVGVGDKPVDLPRALVPVAFACTDIVVPDAGAAGRQCQAKADVDLFELCFRLLLLCDVGLDAHQSDRPALGVALNHAAAIENPYPVTGFVLQPELGLDRIGQAGNVAFAAGHRPLAIVGMRQLQPEIACLGKLALTIAEHLRPHRRVKAVAAREIPIPDAKMRAFERQLPELSVAILLVGHVLARLVAAIVRQKPRRNRYCAAAGVDGQFLSP